MGKRRCYKKHPGADFPSYLRLFLSRATLAVLLVTFMAPASAAFGGMPHTQGMDGGTMDSMFSHHVDEKLAQQHDQNLSSIALGDEACESECSCCPGICSVFLPVAYKPAVLLSRKTLLNTTGITFGPAPAADLLRPPIS